MQRRSFIPGNGISFGASYSPRSPAGSNQVQRDSCSTNSLYERGEMDTGKDQVACGDWLDKLRLSEMEIFNVVH